MADTQFLIDGATDFLGGQDASKIPAKIAPNAYFAGVNISISKGIPQPRWGAKQLKFILPEGELDISNNRTVPYATIFESGRYQALVSYLVGQTYYLIVVINGIIFFINQDTLVVTVIPLTDGSHLNETSPRLATANAGKYVVIFDYPNLPVIIEGVSARRSNPANDEVPTSVLGAYNQNRLFISNVGNEFTGGDPTGDLATPDAPITFYEVLTPSAPYFNQVFQLPTNFRNEPITAMAFLDVTDTSTGIGPLLVSTAEAIYSYQTQLPRNAWQVNGFGTQFIGSSGIAGPRAFTNVNSDLFFLSSDGQIRSASMSRDEQKKWSKIPVSKEVANFLKYYDKSLVQYGFMGYFNNKIFAGANPYRTKALTNEGVETFDIAHGGLVAISLDNMSNLTNEGVPAWDGLWTPCRPMDMVTSGKRCFIISKDAEFTNVFYELNQDLTYDIGRDGDIRYTHSILYTRDYDFKDPFQNKDLHSIDLGIRNVQGDLNLEVLYKPSHGSEFVEWVTFKHNAPWRSCSVPTDCSINGLYPHNFRDLTAGVPIQLQACDPISNILYSSFRRLQLKFVIEGKFWELQEYKLKARIRDQNELETICNTYNECKLQAQCNDDWVIGDFKSCQSQET